MKKILICGAAGMVGRSLIDEALHTLSEYEVWAADLNVDVYSNIDDSRFHAILNHDLDSVMAANHFNVMLQMAFPRNVKPDQWAAGISFCFEVLFLAKKYNVERVVHVSSQSLYGWQREGTADEESPAMLVSPYTTGKYCAEQLCKNLFKAGAYTNVRLSTIIGPLTKERVVNKLIDNVIKGQDLVIQGGNQVFSFLDVRDAAKGLLSILTKDNISLRHAYNLGTNENLTLLDIAHIVIEEGEKHNYMGSKLIVEQADVVLNNKISVSAVKDDFNWESKYSIKESINYIFDTQK